MTGTTRRLKVTAVHEPPVYYDLAASVDRAADAVRRAAADGSRLVVFSEAWLPGYVDFVWEMTPSQGPHGEFTDIFRRLWDNAVDLSTDILTPIQDAARETETVVVLGVEEKSGGTLYNTGVIIDADGSICHRHRKVMPTNAERQVWGFGDGSTLRVVDTAVGRIGLLLCWENYMPLARAALYAQNVEIWCAPTADTRMTWHMTMQHIAKEGGCAVIGCAPCVRADDIPADLPSREVVVRDYEWLSDGNASIVNPGGELLVGPAKENQSLIHADIDLSLITEARRVFDATGHYSRPDIFNLTVDRNVKAPVRFI